MQRLIKREWERKKTKIFIRCAVITALTFTVFLGYKLAPSFFLDVRNTINSIPDFLKGILGLRIFGDRSDLALFLVVGSVLVNFVNLSLCGMEAADDLVCEERSGMASYLCGRLCTRPELLKAKTGFTIVTTIAGQVAWGVMIGLLGTFGSAIPQQRVGAILLCGRFILFGVICGMLSVTVGALLGIAGGRDAYSNHWENIGIAFLLTIFLANPLRQYHFIYIVGIALMSLILSVSAVIIELYEYQKRDI